MIQLRNFVRLRIDPRQVRTLVQIAIDAGKGKVVEVVGPAVNPWDDVFDVEGGQRNEYDYAEHIKHEPRTFLLTEKAGVESLILLSVLLKDRYFPTTWNEMTSKG